MRGQATEKTQRPQSPYLKEQSILHQLTFDHSWQQTENFKLVKHTVQLALRSSENLDPWPMCAHSWWASAMANQEPQGNQGQHSLLPAKKQGLAMASWENASTWEARPCSHSCVRQPFGSWYKQGPQSGGQGRGL